MYILKVLTAALLICQIEFAMGSVFDIVPKGVDASQGRQIILQCTLKKEFINSYTISWVVDGKEIENGQRYKITDGQLNFEKVDKDLDSGKFQCLATNVSDPEDEYFTDPVVLNIKWLELGAVLLRMPEEEGMILPGERVMLRCNVTGNPKPRSKDIKWFVDGKDLNMLTQDLAFPMFQSIEVNKDRLIIPSIALGVYDGVYSCCVSQNLEKRCSSSNYALQVRDISVPVLVTAPKDLIVQQSGDAQFYCGFSAIPTPMIEWFDQEEEPLTNKSRPGEECRVCVYPNGTIIIRRVKTRHEGIYTCKATGSKGNVTSASAEMKIAYIKPFSEPQIEEEYIKLGPNIEKVCNVPQAEPAASITWMRNGQEIAVSDGTSSPRVTVSGNALVITSVQTSDEGNYQCVAHNMAGNMTKTFRFLIASAPKMRSQLVSRTEMEGNDVILKCDVDANPPVRYTWYKNSTLITSSDHFITLENQLTIKSITVEDADNYECVARNSQGVTRSSAWIRVNEQLKLDPEPTDTFIEIGKRTEIVCAARGTKHPEVQWSTDVESKSYKIISNGHDLANKSLVFINPQVEDGGIFVCTARATEIDSSLTRTRAITVTVGIMPKITKQMENPTVFEGTSVRLDCGISHMNDLSKLRWVVHANSTTMIYTASTNSIRDHCTVMNNGSLYVKNAVVADSGYYSCSYRVHGFEVHQNVTLLVAENDGPITPPQGPDEDGNDDRTPEYKKIQTVALAVGCSVAYLILTITIIVYCRRKKRHKKTKGGMPGEVIEEDDSDDEERLMINGSATNGHSKKNGIPLQPVTHLEPDIENLQYDPTKLEKVTVIGHGEFGEVYLSKAPGLFPDLDEDILVMVKMFEPGQEKTQGNYSQNNANGQISDSSFGEPVYKTQRCEFNREVRLLHLANHENIVRLLGVCSKQTNSPTSPDHLITEYLEWGILKLCLQASREGKLHKFSKHLKMRMCCQIAAGLEHLTKLGLAHQDVATRNCVISSKMLIKLTILSLTKEGFETEYCSYKGKPAPIRWMPPEALFDDCYNLKSDVWSFGVTCWEIFTLGTTPFSDLSNEQFLEENQSDNPPTLPPLENSKRITSLISKCCQLSPDSRPEFHQIVRKLKSILCLESKTTNALSEATSPNETDVDATGPLLSPNSEQDDDDKFDAVMEDKR